MRCPECNAISQEARAVHCAFCGAVLRELAAPAGPDGDVRARFAALRAHPALPGLLRERPPAGAGYAPGAIRMAFGLLFAGTSVGFIVTHHHPSSPFSKPFFQESSSAVFFDAVPGLFVAIGVGLALFGVHRLVRFARSPWESYPALVRGGRAHVTRHDDTTTTNYFVTLEDEAGDRVEVTTTGNLVGGVSPGDIGIAHVRDGMLLGFRRAKM